MKTCYNHPDKEAISVCHHCGKDYCYECLDEGKEYYYCKNPECQEILRKELAFESMPEYLLCPNCESELEPTEEERLSGQVHCTECDALINYKVHPPEIINKENYIELLSSMNQGDIALIKSILEGTNIDYYVLGENFLSLDPLIQPARFFVNLNQLQDVKELLKGFDLHIWGASANEEENEEE